MPFWSPKRAPQPIRPPVQHVNVSWKPAINEDSDDEGHLLAAIADLLTFVEGADDDRFDPDAAVQIEEDLAFRLASLSPGAIARVRDRLLALADAEAAQGTREATIEVLRAMAEQIDPAEEGRACDDNDGKVLDLALADAIMALETLGNDRLDPDDAMKAMELAAWHLSHLSADGKARFLASTASEAAAVSSSHHSALMRGLADALDLVDGIEPFDAQNAEVPGQAMLTRKRVVLTTPKARDQAIRQAEALRQNGYVGRWEVPDERQAGRAQRLLRDAAVRNIGVRVVGA